eukprot:767243-Hanusia_phi.AAC.10
MMNEDQDLDSCQAEPSSLHAACLVLSPRSKHRGADQLRKSPVTDAKGDSRRGRALRCVAIATSDVISKLPVEAKSDDRHSRSSLCAAALRDGGDDSRKAGRGQRATILGQIYQTWKTHWPRLTLEQLEGQSFKI